MDGMVQKQQETVGIAIVNLFEECALTDPLLPYQATVREWATTYLTAPHPELGRAGPVCPFTAPSINKELFWVGCDNRPELTARAIQETVVGLLGTFAELPPREGPDVLLKTVLVLLPTVTDYAIIDDAQEHLKEEFVALGLMVGQFYPGCDKPGLWNAEFKPLRSPIPLLAIRHMVSSDFPFLSTKTKWIERYLKKFAPSVPATVRSIIAKRFDA